MERDIFAATIIIMFENSPREILFYINFKVWAEITFSMAESNVADTHFSQFIQYMTSISRDEINF